MRKLLDPTCSQLEIAGSVRLGHLEYQLNLLGHRILGPQNKLMVHRTTGILVDIFPEISQLAAARKLLAVWQLYSAIRRVVPR